MISLETLNLYQLLNLSLDQDISFDGTKLQCHLLECIGALLDIQTKSENSAMADGKSVKWKIFWKYLSELSLELSNKGDEDMSNSALWMAGESSKDINGLSDSKDLLHLQLASSCTNIDDTDIQTIGKKCLKSANKYYSKTGRRVTPFHLAAKVQKPNLRVIRRLNNFFLRMGRVKDPKGHLPLHFACRYSNSIEMVQELLQDYPEGLYSKNDSGDTPIHLLCFNTCENAPEVLRMLLMADPSIARIPGNDGRYPLHVILGENNLLIDAQMSMFTSLLSAYPEAAAERDSYGNPPFVWLCRQIPESAPADDLFIDMVSMMLRECPRAATVSCEDGRLPLHCIQNVTVAKLLVETFPDALSVNIERYGTPLHQAAGKSNVEVIEYLYKCRSESFRAHNEFSPLVFAVSFSDSINVVQYVHSLDPSVLCAVTDTGNTPLHEFIDDYQPNSQGSDRGDILRFLLNNYPEAASIANNDGETPYSICKQKEVPIYFYRLILRAGPAVDPKELRRLNYIERRMAMFLFFVAVQSDGEPTLFISLKRVSYKDNSLVRGVVAYL